MLTITLNEFIYLLPFLALSLGIVLLLFLAFVFKIKTKIAAIFTFVCLFVALISSSIIGYEVISHTAVENEMTEVASIATESVLPTIEQTDAIETAMNPPNPDVQNELPWNEDFSIQSAKIWKPTYITSLFTCDGYGLLYTCLILLMAMVVSTLSYKRLEFEKESQSLFYLILLFSTLGAVILVYSSHLISLFIGIELLTTPLIGLIGSQYKQKHSLEAAIKYMVLSGVASAFLLLGIAFYYSATGELTFSGLSFQLSILTQPSMLLLLGVCLMLVGICFKLSLVPFHVWLPDVYQGAPSCVTLLLTAGKIAVFCAVTRLFLLAPIVNNEIIRTIMVIIAFISIILGNIYAVNQQNIQRLLAYSSITHFGYLLIALIAVQYQVLALETLGVYLIGYILASICVVSVICLEGLPRTANEKPKKVDLTGLFWRRPILALAMAVGLLSFASIPLTVGFIGRFSLILLGVTAELWWLVGAIIIGSALGLYFYLRLVASFYIRGDNVQTTTTEAVKSNLISKLGINETFIVLSAVLIILCGIYPKWLFDIVSLAQFLSPN